MKEAHEQYQYLSSLISKREKSCNELSAMVDKNFQKLVDLYENQIISDLKDRLRLSGISFDEYVFRYNRMFGRYHCLYEEDPFTLRSKYRRLNDTDIYVGFGSSLLRVMKWKELPFVVESFLYENHPYDPDDDKMYDIAVLRLSKPFSYNKKVQPIALATYGEEYALTRAIFDIKPYLSVVGWGLTLVEKKENMITLKEPLQLQQTLIQPLSEEEVGRLYKYKASSPTILTTTNQACFGDSGSPIYDAIDGKNVLLGIVSHALGQVCGQAQAAFQTRVASFKDWIEEKTDSY